MFDLHVHTTYSDGDFTPIEVAWAASRKGLKAIAITDHDECRGALELKGKDIGIDVISGIEIAAKYEGEVHVLGLLIDCDNAQLSCHIKKTLELRAQRAEGILAKLNSSGIRVSYEDVKKEFGSGALGRPHIAAALVKNGYAGSSNEAFNKYLSKHGEFYVPYEKIDIRGAVKLINGAGGKAVLAHPGLLNPDILNTLWPKLKDIGFWGVEAYHPSHSDEQCAEFEKNAVKYGLFVTAGSDFHGSAKPLIEIGQEIRGGEYLKKSGEALGI